MYKLAVKPSIKPPGTPVPLMNKLKSHEIHESKKNTRFIFFYVLCTTDYRCFSLRALINKYVIYK